MSTTDRTEGASPSASLHMRHPQVPIKGVTAKRAEGVYFLSLTNEFTLTITREWWQALKPHVDKELDDADAREAENVVMGIGGVA